jgi:hypothetical protein
MTNLHACETYAQRLFNELAILDPRHKYEVLDILSNMARHEIIANARAAVGEIELVRR